MRRLLYTDHGREPTIVAIAKRLQATGTLHMVVIDACMRKMPFITNPTIKAGPLGTLPINDRAAFERGRSA